MSEHDADLGAFVHVDDVVDPAVRALDADLDGHIRLTLCGPGDFDSSLAESHPRLDRKAILAVVGHEPAL